MARLFINATVLVDGAMQQNCAVLVKDRQIAAIGRAAETACEGAETVDLGGYLIAPGFVDTQVNGGGGAMFCDAPTIQTLAGMVQAHRRFGTTAMLPTLITSNLEITRRAAEAVSSALADGMAGIAGIHFEGPLLNPARKGVHDAALFQHSSAELLDIFTSINGGKVMVTLAPEQTGVAFIERLVERGIIVSLGHTACTFDQAQAGFAAGARSVTHLFNAMPPLLSRDPGPIAAALLDPSVFCGLIVDGHHVDPAALRVALAAMGRGRTVLVTDAMADVGPTLGDFALGQQPILYRDGKLTTDQGTLAGSALSMIEAVRNAIAMLDMSPADALAAASATPARMIGCDDQLGAIKVGHQADFVILDPQLNVVGTAIKGALEWYLPGPHSD